MQRSQISEIQGEALTTIPKLPVNYPRVSIAEHLEQLTSVAECVYRVSLIRCFDGIFKPIGEAGVRKNFFEGHNHHILLSN